MGDLPRPALGVDTVESTGAAGAGASFVFSCSGMTVVSMIGLDMLVFLFGNLGGDTHTPLRGDESCAQTHERKGVKGDSVVHAGIEGSVKPRKEKR